MILPDSAHADPARFCHDPGRIKKDQERSRSTQDQGKIKVGSGKIKVGIRHSITGTSRNKADSGRIMAGVSQDLCRRIKEGRQDQGKIMKLKACRIKAELLQDQDQIKPGLKQDQAESRKGRAG